MRPFAKLAFALALAALGSRSAAGAAAPLPGDLPSDPVAAKLLLASIDAPRHVSYVGQMESLRWGTTRAAATIFKVEHRAPDLTRRWFIAPQALYGDYVIANGSSFYEYDVKHGKVSISKNPAIDERVLRNDNYALLTRNYRVVSGPAENVANHRSTSINLINKYTGERLMHIGVDAKTHLVLERTVYRSDGSIASQVRFDGLRYTSNIPVSLFTTETPPGFTTTSEPSYGRPSSDLEAVEKSAGFQPRNPRYLPEGFQAISADVTDVKGVKTLHYLYSDGIRSLSLFENARGAAPDFGRIKPAAIRWAKHEGQFVEDGPTTLLTWREDALGYALVGDIGRRELTKIAASIAP